MQWSPLQTQVRTQYNDTTIFPSSRFSAYFGAVRGPIFLDNVQCVGTEFELSECAHLSFTVNNCGHSEDAGVACTGKCIPLVLFPKIGLFQIEIGAYMYMYMYHVNGLLLHASENQKN